jgi:hypothetical protein
MFTSTWVRHWQQKQACARTCCGVEVPLGGATATVQCAAAVSIGNCGQCRGSKGAPALHVILGAGSSLQEYSRRHTWGAVVAAGAGELGPASSAASRSRGVRPRWLPQQHTQRPGISIQAHTAHLPAHTAHTGAWHQHTTTHSSTQGPGISIQPHTSAHRGLASAFNHTQLTYQHTQQHTSTPQQSGWQGRAVER